MVYLFIRHIWNSHSEGLRSLFQKLLHIQHSVSGCRYIHEYKARGEHIASSHTPVPAPHPGAGGALAGRGAASYVPRQPGSCGLAEASPALLYEKTELFSGICVRDGWLPMDLLRIR